MTDHTPRRMVIRLPNWLGDIVMAVPALVAVRARWPEAHLTVAVPRGFAPIAEILPGLDDVVPLVLDGGWRSRRTFEEDVAAIRRGGFDVGLLLPNSFASARMLSRAGVPERWGYAGEFRTRLLTRAVPRPPRRAADVRHHARYYARLVENLGAPRVDLTVALSVPDVWRARGDALLREAGVDDDAFVIAFAPGAAYGTAKRWPPALVSALIDRCQRELHATCVLVGAAGDRGAAAQVTARLARARAVRGGSGALVDLVGRTDLPALVGVATRSRAFVCNDSGTMHLASAIGSPVVAVFGPTDEHETSPLGPHEIIASDVWCRPCLRRECPIDHRCMWSIDPGRVYEGLRSIVTRPQ
jgi:heptosyltransferase-2